MHRLLDKGSQAFPLSLTQKGNHLECDDKYLPSLSFWTYYLKYYYNTQSNKPDLQKSIRIIVEEYAEFISPLYRYS